MVRATLLNPFAVLAKEHAASEGAILQGGAHPVKLQWLWQPIKKIKGKPGKSNETRGDIVSQTATLPWPGVSIQSLSMPFIQSPS